MTEPTPAAGGIVTGRPEVRAIPTQRVAPDSLAARPVDIDRDRHESDPSVRPLRRRVLARSDLLAVASYLLAALWLTYPLWTHVRSRVAGGGFGDRAFAEWNLAFAARVVSQLENPLYSTAMNAPLGVNAMANTSMLGLGVPMAPVTLLFGPAASFDLLIILGLAGTAIGWYYVLSRCLVSSRTVAWLGGLTCGFAPSVVTHASLHPNLTAQFAIPWIVLCVVRLRDGDRWLRSGLLLGLLVVYQAFVNEEMLFFTVLACGLFTGVYAWSHRAEVSLWARPFLYGLGVAAVVAVAALAYPVWWQFWGEGSYTGIETSISLLRTDLWGYTSFATNSVARQLAAPPIPNSPFASLWTGAEDNANLGWPLVVVVIVFVVWLRRHPVVKAAAVTAGVFVLMSFGQRLWVSGVETTIPGPWALIKHLPLFSSALPIRMGMAVTPLAVIILALGLDRLWRVQLPDLTPGARRLIMGGIVAAVLLPGAPLPVQTVERQRIPPFISHGTWRSYVGAGQSVLVVPTTSFFHPEGMLWSTSTGLDLRVSQGYFLGPDIAGHARFGPVPRRTEVILETAQSTRSVPVLTDDDRKQARLDLAYWHTDLIVLSPDSTVPESVLQTVNALFGQTPTYVGGVWVWDVRTVR